MAARPALWVEVVLAVVVGVVAFVVAAAVSTAARSHVPEVLLGLFFLLVVLAVARFAGIMYALPVGVVTIEAFDLYFLPPLHNLDGATMLVLGLFLAMSVIVGAVATQAGRRAAGSERARGILADEQAALRRVATLVARQPAPSEVFAAVTEEAARLLHLDSAHLIVYERDQTATVVGSWNLRGSRRRSACGYRWKGTTSSAACSAPSSRPASTTTPTPPAWWPRMSAPSGFARRSGFRSRPGDGSGGHGRRLLATGAAARGY